MSMIGFLFIYFAVFFIAFYIGKKVQKQEDKHIYDENTELRKRITEI